MVWPRGSSRPRGIEHSQTGKFWSFFGAFCKDYRRLFAVSPYAQCGQEDAEMRKSIRKEESRSVRAIARRRGTFVLACLLTCAARTAAANDLCRAIIVDDLKLDHDLACTGDGLIVGADGIKIDLNGYTITGFGIGVGIAVTGRTDITIAGGTVRNFAVAVRVNTSTDLVIKQNEFVANSEGIDLQSGSVGNTIKDNTFRDSATRGIMLRSNSRDNDIKNNIFTGNRVGILVFGGVDNTLKDNIVSESTLAGIRLNVIATGNLLKDNTVASNVVGIEFIVTPTGSSTGNDLKTNTIAANGCGLKGPTAGNNFTNNSFEGNLADTCS
jgi:parallel beta-helix repeat protein